MLETFHQVEVAELRAAALLDTAAIGPLVPIDEDQIRALEQKLLGE